MQCVIFETDFFYSAEFFWESTNDVYEVYLEKVQPLLL